MATEVSPATALLARTVQGVWLNSDERETVLAELDALRRDLAQMTASNERWRLAGQMLTVERDGAREGRVRTKDELYAERGAHDLAKAALVDANAEIARLRSLPFIEFFKPSPASSLDGVAPPPPERADAGGVSHAAVAQMEEHPPRKREATGSTPASGSNPKDPSC